MVFFCQPPSDCTQFPELHNQLCLLLQPFTSKGLEKHPATNSALLQLDSGKDASEHRRSAQSQSSTVLFRRKEEYTMHMPQTQGPLLKFL